MSTQRQPPRSARQPRQQHLHEIEFFEHFSSSRRTLFTLSHGSYFVRARLMDPRLQRIIAAAANGPVVERFR